METENKVSQEKIEQYLEAVEQKKYCDKIISNFKELVESDLTSSKQQNKEYLGLIKVTRGKDSDSVTVDLKELEKKDNDLYQTLLVDYRKSSKRKGKLTIREI